MTPKGNMAGAIAVGAAGVVLGALFVLAHAPGGRGLFGVSIVGLVLTLTNWRGPHA
jgi:hypothetical protein